MLKITMKIDGMMWGMRESHVNDAVRRAFSVKKATSSHSKGGDCDFDRGRHLRTAAPRSH